MIALVRGLWMPAVAALALSYLVVMLMTGALPERRQLVESEADGVLRVAPERITRVTVSADGSSTAFFRQTNGWTREGKGAPAETRLAETLERAVKFMHTANPVRVLEPEELAMPARPNSGSTARACRSRSKTKAASYWRPISATTTPTVCSSTCA